MRSGSLSSFDCGTVLEGTWPKQFITPDKDAVISEIEIAVPPERIFRALTDHEQAVQWGTNEAYELVIWEMDARLGGKWRSFSRQRGGADAGREFDHTGEILEIDPPRVLAHSWFANWHEDQLHRTVVRWELSLRTPEPVSK